jgi:hypothetical protein
MRWLAAGLLCACVAASIGCGYALAGRGSFLPTTIRTVGIPKLENRSTFFQVEDILTEKIRAEFIGRGKYSVTPEELGADAVLTGEVLAISVVPVGINEQQLASRYLFTVALKVEFTDTHTQDVIWQNDSLIFRGEYDLQPIGGAAGATVVGETFLDQQRSSVDRIATDVARSVVTAILEAF